MRPFLQTLAGKESPCTTPKATEPSCHVARTFRARRALGHLRPRNGMRWRAFLQKRAVRIMTSMIVQNSLSARVGIAVNTKMHTCVVHAYIFAHNAPAFLALSLVLEADASVDRFDGYCRCLKQRGLCKRKFAGLQKFHQRRVVAKAFEHQRIVNAFVMGDAETIQIFNLGTRGDLKVPLFVRILFRFTL